MKNYVLTFSDYRIRFESILCIFIVFLYIVAGNTLTFDISNRLPIKTAELASLLLILLNVKKIVLNDFEIRLLGWIAIGFFSILVNSLIFSYSLGDMLYGSLYIARLLHIILITNVISMVLVKDRVKIVGVLHLFYVMVCCTGFIQLIYYPVAFDFYDIFKEYGVVINNPDPHIGRLLSSYFDPNYLAGCLVIPFSLALSSWMTEHKKMDFILALVYFITVVLTVSRSGLLGFVIATAVIFIKKKYTIKQFNKALLLLIVGALFLSISIMNPSRIIYRIINSLSDPSTHARFETWQRGLSIFNENPIFGIGYNMIGVFNLSYIKSSESPSIGYGNDSSLLLILITTGLIGFIYSLYVLIKELELMNNYKNNPFAKAFTAIFLASIVLCNFNNLLFYPLWLFPMLLLRKALFYESLKEYE